jgi:uncharacterized protein YqgC (DUF456 family)
MEIAAWTCALGGMVLGGLLAPVPGFPGCAVAYLGLVAFAGLTDFRTLPVEALWIGLAGVVVATLVQLVAPAVTSRAAGGAAGAATGAALGATVGLLVPLPGAAWGASLLGAAVGGFALSRRGLVDLIRGLLGTAGGCLTGAVVDAVAILGLATLLAIGDFVSVLR